MQNGIVPKRMKGGIRRPQRVRALSDHCPRQRVVDGVPYTVEKHASPIQRQRHLENVYVVKLNPGVESLAQKSGSERSQAVKKRPLAVP